MELKTNITEEHVVEAKKIASWFYRNISAKQYVWVDCDECWSEALLALAKAARSFSPEKNVSFSSFSFSVIKNALLSFVKKHDWRNVDTLDVAFEKSEDPCHLGIFEQLEDRDMIQHFYDHILTDEERMLFDLRFRGKTQSECADILKKLSPDHKYSQAKVHRKLSIMYKKYCEYRDSMEE